MNGPNDHLTRADGSPLRVLVVDDEVNIAELLSMALRYEGWETRAASGPAAGTAHRGRHLVDARTGRPLEGLAEVTVVGPSLTWADIDATAAYALGAEALAWLRFRPACGLLVGEDGSVTVFGEPGRA